MRDEVTWVIVIIVMALVMAGAFAYHGRRVSACEDAGGIFVRGACLKRDSVLYVP